MKGGQGRLSFCEHFLSTCQWKAKAMDFSYSGMKIEVGFWMIYEFFQSELGVKLSWYKLPRYVIFCKLNTGSLFDFFLNNHVCKLLRHDTISYLSARSMYLYTKSPHQSNYRATTLVPKSFKVRSEFLDKFNLSRCQACARPSETKAKVAKTLWGMS